MFTKSTSERYADTFRKTNMQRLLGTYLFEVVIQGVRKVLEHLDMF